MQAVAKSVTRNNKKSLPFHPNDYKWVKNVLKLAQRDSTTKDFLHYRQYTKLPLGISKLSDLLGEDGHSGGSAVWTCDAASYILRNNVGMKRSLKGLKYQFFDNFCKTVASRYE